MRRYLSLALVLVVWTIFNETVCQAQTTGSNLEQIYGSSWEIGATASTNLTLEAFGGAVSATVVVYSPDGSQLATKAVDLPAGQATSVSLSDFVPGAGRGALAVQWPAGDGWVRGTVTILHNGGISASYALLGGYNANTANTLYAPWYLPDAGTNGNLSLFNPSSAAIAVDISVAVSGAAEKKLQTVALRPGTTQFLGLRSLLEAGNIPQTTTLGSIVLRYSGTSHLLQSFLFIENDVTGFALTPTFAAKNLPSTTIQSTWHFPLVRIAGARNASAGSPGLSSYALVTNSTGTQLAPLIHAYAVVNRVLVSLDLNIPALAPYETRLINLSAAVQSQATSTTTNTQVPVFAGVTVASPTSVGDLAVSVFTMTSASQVTAIASGILLPTRTPQLAYWVRQPSRPYYVKNAASNAFVTLYYQDGLGVKSFSAAVPAPTPAANGSGANGIDLSGLFQASSGGLNGDLLPAAVNAGLLLLTGFQPNTLQIAEAQPACWTDCSSTPPGSQTQAASPLTQTTAQTAELSGVQPEFDSGQNGYIETPCIYLNGKCVNNQTVDVVVGQQIYLYTELALPYGTYATSPTWYWGAAGGANTTPTTTSYDPSGYAIGCLYSYDYHGSIGTPCAPDTSSTPNPATSPALVASHSSAAGGGFNPSNYPLPSHANPNDSQNVLNDSAYTFWWVYQPPPGVSSTIYFVYTDGVQSNAAWVTFNVIGPSPPQSSQATTTYNPSSGIPLVVTNLAACSNSFYTLPGGPVISYGLILTRNASCVVTGTPGIGFNSPTGYSDQSGGSFIPVQLLNTDVTTGSWSETNFPGLDKGYPYPYTSLPGLLAADAPGIDLLSSGYSSGSASETRTFSASMFLLWEPNAINAIPVPLGYQTWGFSGTTTCSSSCTILSNWSTSLTGGTTTGNQGSWVESNPSQTSEGPNTLNMGYPYW